MILHLHGFRSVGTNAKYYILKRAFKDEEVISPTLPCNPFETVPLIDRILTGRKEHAIVVGTSLGGYYAYYCAAVHGVPAILVNPSLRPWERLRDQVGVQTRIETGERFEWKSEYMDVLEELNIKIENAGVKDHLLSFFLARDDELIDHSEIEFSFPFARNVKYFDKSGHIFKRFQELIPDIRQILEEARKG